MFHQSHIRSLFKSFTDGLGRTKVRKVTNKEDAMRSSFFYPFEDGCFYLLLFI